MKGLLEFFGDRTYSRGHRAKGLETQVFMILAESALSILLAQQDISQQGVRRSGVRHSRYGFAGMRSRFLPAPQEPVGLGQFIMARRGIGLQFEATEQNPFGLGILLGFVENSAQRQVRVRSSAIELSGPLQ